ncbi:MAG TPA: TIGR03435 family protein [Acidobacteriaceae bacterium]|nr:TIGR03435 family protein [Acidobacteriaceae bacterium]
MSFKEGNVKLCVAVALVFCIQGVGLAQGNSKRPEFAAATIKLAPAAESQSSGEMKSGDAGSVNVTADRASYQGVTLKRLLTIAYDLKPVQITGPAWIETERYDVVATIPPGAPKEQIPGMLRHLLGDRFQISQHTEKKDEAAYFLRLGSSGPKLKPSSSDHPRTITGFKMSATGVSTDQAEMRFIGVTIADFAESLSGKLDRPVIDQTGLPGRFDLTFPIDALDPPPGSATLSSALFTGVHSVGLRLDPGQAPVEHLVVDKAEKVPAED